jgi:hypothetical protein
MLDLDFSHAHASHEGVLGGLVEPHVKSNFALKVINFAADNNSYRLICNSGNADACKAHCKKQFPGPDKALAADECTKAVAEAYGGGLMGGLACFPMTSTVTRRADGKIPLSKLREGDEILVSSGSEIHFDTVIGFLHFEESVSASFLSISFGNGALYIHRDHLLPVTRADASSGFARASSVVPGDSLNTLWIDGSLVPTRVVSIDEVSGTGLCCPVTTCGTIIVDSVECSCYSAPSGLFAFSVSHGLCHASMAPLRFYFSLKKDASRKWKPESGVHPYAKLLMSLGTGASFA